MTRYPSHPRGQLARYHFWRTQFRRDAAHLATGAFLASLLFLPFREPVVLATILGTLFVLLVISGAWGCVMSGRRA